jgi:U2 small nuclear ribonucleoprotein A'
MVKSVPALNTLVLSQNNVAELADLEVLRGFKKLTFVSLVDNPVTNKEVRIHSVGAGNLNTDLV